VDKTLIWAAYAGANLDDNHPNFEARCAATGAAIEEAQRAPGSGPAVADLLLVRASAERHAGHFDAASNHFRQALQHYERLERLEGQALARIGVASIGIIRREYKPLERELAQVRALAERVPVPLVGSLLEYYDGVLHSCTGRHEIAKERLQKAAAILEDGGGSSAENAHRAKIQFNQGMNEFRRGQMDEAQHWFSRAEASARAQEYLLGLGRALRANGMLKTIHEGNAQHAFCFYQEALALFHQIGYPQGILQCLVSLGRVSYESRDFDRAGMHLKAAQALADELRLDTERGEVLSRLGFVRMNLCDFAAAEKCFRQDIEICEQTQDRRAYANALKNLGFLLILTGSLTEAEQRCRHALKLFEEVHDNFNQAMAALHLARALAEMGKFDDAEQQLGAARTTLIAADRKNQLHRVELLAGIVARKRGDPEKAFNCFSSVEEALSHQPPSYQSVVLFTELGLTSMAQQRPPLATRYLRKAIETARFLRISDLERKALDALKEANPKEFNALQVSPFSVYPSPRSQSEVLPVTVLAAEVRWPDEMLQAGRLREIQASLSKFLERAATLAFRHSGQLFRQEGDRILVIFGLPEEKCSPSQAAWEAVLTAHELIQAATVIEQNNEQLSLQVGAGVASDKALCCALEFLERREFAAVGPAVSLARQLRTKAAGGEILASQGTADLLSGHAGLVADAPLKLEGFPDPQNVYRVLPEALFLGSVTGRDSQPAAPAAPLSSTQRVSVPVRADSGRRQASATDTSRMPARQSAEPARQAPPGDSDYDVFISYRRDGGADAARLLRDRLRDKGLRVFLDVDEIRVPEFGELILRVIEKAHYVVVILTPGCLARFDDPEDWMRQEIAHSLRLQKHIVAIFKDGFGFPKGGVGMPADVQALHTRSGITWSHEYFQGAIDKLLEFIRRG